VQRLVDLCVTDPAAAAASFGRMSPPAMSETVLAMSGGADRAVYSHPAFAAAYRRALDEAFAPGPHGYAVDTVLSMTRWPSRCPASRGRSISGSSARTSGDDTSVGLPGSRAVH